MGDAGEWWLNGQAAKSGLNKSMLDLDLLGREKPALYT